MATYVPQQDEDAASVGGEKGVPILAVRNSAAAAKTDAEGDFTFLATDSAGRLGVSTLGSTLAVSGSVGLTAGKNEDAGSLSGDAGLPALAVRNDAAAARTSADGDYSWIAVDSAGRVGIADLGGTISVDGSIFAGIVPLTSGGLTTFHLVSAATTNATNVKASAGQLYGWFIYNSNAAARKVAFHNTSGTPTAGSSVFFSLVIPATSGANVFGDIGIAFSSGIGITTVTGLADSDATAVAANDLIINLFYS